MAARALVEQLSHLAPVFHVRPDQIHFLSSPKEFYDFILNSIKTGKTRVSLATLYLGTGEKEVSLVEALKKRVASDANFKVHIHTDHLRGTRGFPHNSSIDVLRPLLGNPQVTVSMYRTPLLADGWRRLVPSRWNEIFGLSHLKVFVVDHQVVMTGANLSDDYFTDRADRYLCVKDHPALANYFYKLLEEISSFSLGFDNVATPEHKFIERREPQVSPLKADQVLEEFISQQVSKNRLPSIEEKVRGETFILPTIQMAPHGILQDELLLYKLMQLVQTRFPHCQPALATGYFNLAPLAQHIFSQCQGLKNPWRILTSSPQANGFYESPGLSRYIPDAYRSIELSFLEALNRPPLVRNDRDQEVLFEYGRDGWTFHAKGLWLDAGSDLVATVVGSSNFGHRSFSRDLEAQLTIITDEPSTSQAIRRDRDDLFGRGMPVSKEDIISQGAPSTPVTQAARLFKSFL